MKVAYLVNQYPTPSHAWMRREIRAVERHGVEVVRYSIRPVTTRLVDEQDIEEAKNTRCILARGVIGLAMAVARTVAPARAANSAAEMPLPLG